MERIQCLKFLHNLILLCAKLPWWGGLDCACGSEEVT